jgi:hypothetical protein
MNKKELAIFEKILWSEYDKNKYEKVGGKLIWRHKEIDRLYKEKNNKEPYLIFFVQKLPEWFSLSKFRAGKHSYEYQEIFSDGKINNCFLNYKPTKK